MGIVLSRTFSFVLTCRYLNVNMDLKHFTQKKKDFTHLRAVAAEAQTLKEEAERRRLGEDISEGEENSDD